MVITISEKELTKIIGEGYIPMGDMLLVPEGVSAEYKEKLESYGYTIVDDV